MTAVVARRIVERIREAKAHYGYSLTDLVEAMKNRVSKAKLQRWLDPHRPQPMHADDISAVASAIGISVGALYKPPGAPWPRSRKRKPSHRHKFRTRPCAASEPAVKRSAVLHCPPCNAAPSKLRLIPFDADTTLVYGENNSGISAILPYCLMLRGNHDQAKRV